MKDLMWPRNKRESDLVQQQIALSNYFRWYEFFIGFSCAMLLFGICSHAFGG